ncbi:hypothetical protein EV426DRAFT_576848 [Tirmania nivea]|nr:hypothetical protein EV426DRAFT_576848 [Tirmania nivea]
MSTPIIKRQNTFSGFKSRIPVACGHHRPDSNKPLISALGDLSAGMKSRIPLPKNPVKDPKRHTPASVTPSDAGRSILKNTGDRELQTAVTTVCNRNRFHDSIKQSSVPDTESRAALGERTRKMKFSIQRSLSSYSTVAANTKKSLVSKNIRPETSAVVARKLPPPISQLTPVMVNSSAEICKSPLSTAFVTSTKVVVTRKTPLATGQSVSVIGNKSVVARKPSPPTGEPTPVVADNAVDTRKFAPPTAQSASVTSKKAVVTRRPSPPNRQSASAMAKKSVVTDELSPSTGQPTPIMTDNSSKTLKVSQSTGQCKAMANNSVKSRKFSPAAGQPMPTMTNKFVVARQSAPVKGNKPVLKGAIRQTKAARYLKRMRPRNVPLPGAPQRAPKRIVLPGDYTRPKRTVGKSGRKKKSEVGAGSKGKGTDLEGCYPGATLTDMQSMEMRNRASWRACLYGAAMIIGGPDWRSSKLALVIRSRIELEKGLWAGFY